MNRPAPVLLIAITALALAAMATSLLGGEWLFDLYWYWWVPTLGLVSLFLLARVTRRWWLLALVPVFLFPLLFLVYFDVMCGGSQHCI